MKTNKEKLEIAYRDLMGNKCPAKADLETIKLMRMAFYYGVMSGHYSTLNEITDFDKGTATDNMRKLHEEITEEVTRYDTTKFQNK